MEYMIETERNKILYSHGIPTDTIENVIVSKRDYDNVPRDSNNGTLILFWEESGMKSIYLKGHWK